MSAVVTYMGFVLESDGQTYRSVINGTPMQFDTAGMWVEYINKIRFYSFSHLWQFLSSRIFYSDIFIFQFLYFFQY